MKTSLTELILLSLLHAASAFTARPCASEPCGVLTVLMFLPPCSVSKIGIVVGTVATGDLTSQPYARLFRGELADDRQPKKFVLIGLIHQDDPDPKAGKHENQHQRQSD